MLTMPTETITTPWGVKFEAPLIYTPPFIANRTAVMAYEQDMKRGTLSWLASVITRGEIGDADSMIDYFTIFSYMVEKLRVQAQDAMARFGLEAGPSIYLVQPGNPDPDFGTPFPILHCYTPTLFPVRMHMEDIFAALCKTPLTNDLIRRACEQTASLRACTDFITGA